MICFSGDFNFWPSILFLILGNDYVICLLLRLSSVSEIINLPDAREGASYHSIMIMGQVFCLFLFCDDHQRTSTLALVCAMGGFGFIESSKHSYDDT